MAGMELERRPTITIDDTAAGDETLHDLEGEKYDPFAYRQIVEEQTKSKKQEWRQQQQEETTSRDGVQPETETSTVLPLCEQPHKKSLHSTSGVEVSFQSIPFNTYQLLH
jgi:hypothetical protein